MICAIIPYATALVLSGILKALKAPAQAISMEVSEAKRLRELESENAKLKRLLAEAELDKAALKEIVEGKW